MNNISLRPGGIYEFKSGDNGALKLGLCIGTYYYAGKDYYLLEIIEEKTKGYALSYKDMTSAFAGSSLHEQAQLIKQYYFNSPPEGKRYVSRNERDIVLEINKDWFFIQLNYAYK